MAWRAPRSSPPAVSRMSRLSIPARRLALSLARVGCEPSGARLVCPFVEGAGAVQAVPAADRIREAVCVADEAGRALPLHLWGVGDAPEGSAPFAQVHRAGVVGGTIHGAFGERDVAAPARGA